MDVMRNVNNTKNSIVSKHKYENLNQNSNQENENTRNDSIFEQTSKRRHFVVYPNIIFWIHVL